MSLFKYWYKGLSFMFRFGAKRTLHQLPTAFYMPSTAEEQDLAFDKLDSALGLIARYAPEKFKAMQEDIRAILIAPDPSFVGCYIQQIRMVELQEEYVLNPQTTPQSLSGTLIHEAQHARLHRLGFGYDEPIRGRIEKLCFRAERNLAQKIPGCEELAAQAEMWMEADLEPIVSNEGRRRTDLKALGKLGLPDWLVKLVTRTSRRRAR